MMRYIGCLFICLLWLFRATALFAVSNDQKPILIICSYNPAAHQTSVTISDYMEEYSKLGGKRDIIIENMNCKSFSEAPLWKNKSPSADPAEGTQARAKARGTSPRPMSLLLRLGTTLPPDRQI